MKPLIVDITRTAAAGDINLPAYMSDRAAGMDITAAVPEALTINPGERRLIPTGLIISLPEGYEAQVRPRSGLALRWGITLLNAPGTIDADYRGEIKVILINHGKDPFTVMRGDRIAQMVISPVCRVFWRQEENLDSTCRGSGGFGSTG